MTKETYEKSVDILLDAYNNEKLEHGDCTACAVGNLLHGSRKWINLFMTVNGIQEKIHSQRTAELAEYEIVSNGYTINELATIEYAFETAIWSDENKNLYNEYKYNNPKEGQYRGLCAVLKVMATIVNEEVPTEENLYKLSCIAHEKYAVTI